MIRGKAILEEMREYLADPAFGDDHYGKYGCLRLEVRKELRELLRYAEALQDFEDQIVPFLMEKVNIMKGDEKIGLISKTDYDFFFKNLLDIDKLVVYDDSTD